MVNQRNKHHHIKDTYTPLGDSLWSVGSRALGQRWRHNGDTSTHRGESV